MFLLSFIKTIILVISRYNYFVNFFIRLEEISISVFSRFYDKDVIVQETFEIESGLYDRLEFLSENIYDASISTLVNACIDDLVETEDVKLYPKDGKELYVKSSLLSRRYSLDNIKSNFVENFLLTNFPKACTIY